MKFDKFTDKVWCFISRKFLGSLTEHYASDNLLFQIPNFVDNGQWQTTLYDHNIKVISDDKLTIRIEYRHTSDSETKIKLSWEELKVTWRKIICDKLDAQ